MEDFPLEPPLRLLIFCPLLIDCLVGPATDRLKPPLKVQLRLGRCLWSRLGVLPILNMMMFMGDPYVLYSHSHSHEPYTAHIH